MRNIYLTGFMGSGKSAVGARLAARLGRPYRDLDATIVAGAGMTIPAIFAQEGEAAFRRREADALRRVAAEGGQVVATGGGIVADAANREVMRASGWIVCLEARPETLYARVRAQAGEDDLHSARPLLAAPDPLARIRDLKASRQPAYADADWTVHTDGLGVDEVADEVARAVALLERRAGAACDTAPAGGFPLGAKWFGRDRPLVCVPLVAATADEALDLARRAAPLAPDALELRADYLRDLTPARVAPLLRRLAAVGLPVVFTDRAAAEGGAGTREEAARLAVIAAAIAGGLPALVDLELATAEPDRARLLAAARERGVPVMLSFHDFRATPDDDALWVTLRAMAAAGAAAAKLAVMPRDAADALRLLAVCRAATAGPAPLGIPVAAMAMGPLGVVTRVLGHRAGSALTFAAAAPGAGSAPGQLTVAQLRDLWRMTSEC